MTKNLFYLKYRNKTYSSLSKRLVAMNALDLNERVTLLYPASYTKSKKY